MRPRRSLVRGGVLILFLFVMARSLPAAEVTPADDPVNVMLLYSGDLFIPASIVQDAALRQAFTSGTSRLVRFRLESLQADTLAKDEYEVELADFLRRKYQGQKIDLIVAGGGLALDFLERNRTNLWPETPAVFLSVSESLGLHQKLLPGITGVTIKFDPTATVDFALRLQPEARRVVVVSGVSGDDLYWVPEIQQYILSHHPNLSVTCLTNQTVAELGAQLHRLPADTIVIYTTVFVDAAGKRCVPRDVAAQLAAVSGAPLYGVFETLLDHGIVGGVMPDLAAHGRQAGELGLRIIGGESPAAIPVQPAQAGVPVVDWRQLQRWHISESRLPPGSKVRFRTQTLWEQHKGYIISGLCIIVGQAITIAVLLLHRNRRRRAEAFARNLGGRLINAQEDERSRIARDLHDDLNQRLALLSVEMDMLCRAGSEKGEDTSVLDSMGKQVKDLSSEIHKLAYQLHPAKLFQLGLVAAGRGYCRDLAQKSAVKIEFIAVDVPDEIPPPVALCCYRVIQESLGNVIRHSGAQQARVELSADARQLRLVISDAGHGFDAGAARQTDGLGLVSMKERVRLLNGKIEIKSAPGRGTRVELWVPLPAADSERVSSTEPAENVKRKGAVAGAGSCDAPSQKVGATPSSRENTGALF